MPGVHLLTLHIAAGIVATISGSVALYSVKGAMLHRRSGTIFVGALLSIALTGALMAASGRTVRPANVIPGLLTTYLAVTALTTVRPRSAGVRRLDRGAMLAALALGLSCVVSAFAMLAIDGAGSGGPAVALLVFGVIPLLAAEGDRRTIRAGRLHGAPRLKRHLWRMCGALFIAMASIVLGRRFPETLRIAPIRVLPFVVLVTMTFWLWRLRRSRRSHRVVVNGVPEGV